MLGLAALLGVALSLGALWAASPIGRPVVAGAVVRFLDDALAGRFELHGITVLPQGGVEVRGLRVFDPDERLVLAVDRARVFADVTRLGRRELGLTVELDGPAVMLEEEEDGRLSLARAFAPARPLLPAEEPQQPAGGRPLAVRISRLAIRNGAVWWVDARGETRLEASALDLDARGLWSRSRDSAEVHLRGEMAAPVAGPLALDAALSREGDALAAPLVSARLGGTSVELAGHADLAARTGRAAVRHFAVDRGDARALAPAAGPGADLEGAAYAEADGRVLSLALAAAPLDAAAPGRAEIAGAWALSGAGPAPQAGFDVALDRVDPSRLHAELPAGEVTLAAHGAFQGAALAGLRGRIELSLSPSRLRRGRLGPATLSARAEGGTVRVDRLEVAAPGLAAAGAGTWREGGDVAGKLGADAADLGAALANVGALLGTPLPRASGRLRLNAAISGTSARPALTARLESGALRAFDTAVRGLRLEVAAAGPLDAPTGRVSGRIAAVAAGGSEVARGLVIDAELGGEEARLDAYAAVPSLGEERIALEARGRLGPRRETLELSALAIRYPGARWALSSAAQVRLAGPSVDRLELVSGPQRLALEGGLGKGGALDARLHAEGVDLGHLPAAWVPHGLAGTVGLDAQAAGTTRRPDVSARVRLAGGAFRNLQGLDGSGDLRLDAAGGRLGAKVSLARARGGSVDAQAEVPWPVDARGPLKVEVAAERLPLEELLALADLRDVPAEGTLAAQVRLDGTLEAPRLRGELRLADGAYDDLFPIVARVGATDEGERLAVELGVEVDGTEAVAAKVGLALALAGSLSHPAAALAALRRAPLDGEVRVPGFPLEKLAGALGIPASLAGRLDATASLAGSIDAPRGSLKVALARGAGAGYRDVDADVSLELGGAAVSAAGAVAVSGAGLATFRGSLAAAPERLLAPAGLRAAPLTLELTVPEGTLARATGEALPVTGTVRGKLSARGTLAAPVVEATLAGAQIGIQGRPLGEVKVEARHGAGRTTARVDVAGASGGSVSVDGQLDAPLGLGADLADLGKRPVEVRLQARALDLGVAAALAPGVIRSASGKLDADVVAKGPLARPSPRGKISLSGPRLSVSEWGDWTDLTLEAEVTDDAVELRTLRARRGTGRLEASASLRGLASGRALLEGRAKAEALTLVRAGMPLATLDLETTASGSYSANALDVELRIPRGVVRLPDRLPRELQSIEQRADIVIGKPPEQRRRRAPVVGARPAEVKPIEVKVHAVAKDQLFVRSNNPRIDLELKADVTYRLEDGASYAEGSVDVIRGQVELIGGRAFQVERGRVQFTGGPPTAALLDVQALYDNPAAKVTVIVSGALLKPDIRLSSQPPMDEAQIAMFIATGRTELKPGAGGVGTITGEEAGKAAVSALATQVFKNLVADKLPLDTVALDAGALRAGKYVTNDIYVGYTRRFEADPERHENPDEVRVEYRITPRWTLESRYGSAQSGGASLVWSKDY